MPTPPQLGSGTVRQSAPKFAKYVVIDGTWKVKDDTQMLRTDDGDSKVYNYTFWRVGAVVGCDWNVKRTEALAEIGDVVAESSPGTLSYVVLAVDNAEYGGMPIKQTVQLATHEGWTATVVAD